MELGSRAQEVLVRTQIERLISSYPSQRMMALRARVRLLARQAGKTANLAILDEIVAALPKGEKGFLAKTGQSASNN